MIVGGIDPFTVLSLPGSGADASTFIHDNAGDYYDGGNCVLMLHFDGANAATTTTDAATNKAVTFVGTAQISTAQSKFGGSSLYLDNSAGVSVTLADSSDWAFGTGDWTIEGWVYWTDLATSGHHGFCGQKTDANNYWGIRTYANSDTSNMVIFECVVGGTTIASYNTSYLTVALNTWYHLTVERDSTGLRCFLNGTEYTFSASPAIGTSSMPDLTGVLNIGLRGQGDLPFKGNIDDFRIVKGKALYTGNFTPPTVSPSPKDVTCVGNAQIDTAQKVFGTGSILFDGTGDYLSLLDSDDYAFGTGNLTIDFWLRFNNVGATRIWHQGVINSNEHSVTITSTYIEWSIYTDPTYGFYRDVSWSPSPNTWYHLAFVRSGDNLYIFINGVSQSTTGQAMGAGYSFPDFANAFSIGARNDGAQSFDGWIDEFRISKGVARWTANFTPPTKAYDTSAYSARAMMISD